ncbi:hypothetical protein PR048_011707 [Dryococelus australis]|uniref:Uncharacterized protein n=1 Tax=Dryococelus australis TaxID=614101 RepID=A0ABQ9HMA3_9NEOP|nr:hypothetical protein PR048_011707 [Dryococelus australis]
MELILTRKLWSLADTRWTYLFETVHSALSLEIMGQILEMLLRTRKTLHSLAIDVCEAMDVIQGLSRAFVKLRHNEINILYGCKERRNRVHLLSHFSSSTKKFELYVFMREPKRVIASVGKIMKLEIDDPQKITSAVEQKLQFQTLGSGPSPVAWQLLNCYRVSVFRVEWVCSVSHSEPSKCAEWDGCADKAGKKAQSKLHASIRPESRAATGSQHGHYMPLWSGTLPSPTPATHPPLSHAICIEEPGGKFLLHSQQRASMQPALR